MNKSRHRKGEFHVLIGDLRNQDQERHHMYFRMSKNRFDELLKKAPKANWHFLSTTDTQCHQVNDWQLHCSIWLLEIRSKSF